MNAHRSPHGDLFEASCRSCDRVFVCHEYAAKSLIWYQRMLGVFTNVCDAEHITDIGEVSAPSFTAFFDTVRARTDSRTGQPISSHSVQGYARAVRALLNWCVREEAWLLAHGKRDKWLEVGVGKRSRQALHKYIYRERPPVCRPGRAAGLCRDARARAIDAQRPRPGALCAASCGGTRARSGCAGTRPRLPAFYCRQLPGAGWRGVQALATHGPYERDHVPGVAQGML